MSLTCYQTDSKRSQQQGWQPASSGEGWIDDGRGPAVPVARCEVSSGHRQCTREMGAFVSCEQSCLCHTVSVCVHAWDFQGRFGWIIVLFVIVFGVINKHNCLLVTEDPHVRFGEFTYGIRKGMVREQNCRDLDG